MAFRIFWWWDIVNRRAIPWAFKSVDGQIINSDSTINQETQKGFKYIDCSFTELAPTFHEYRPEILGGLMEMLLGEIMERKVNVNDYWETLRKGGLSFIFNDDGSIILPKGSYQQQ